MRKTSELPGSACDLFVFFSTIPPRCSYVTLCFSSGSGEKRTTAIVDFSLLLTLVSRRIPATKSFSIIQEAFENESLFGELEKISVLPDCPTASISITICFGQHQQLSIMKSISGFATKKDLKFHLLHRKRERNIAKCAKLICRHEQPTDFDL